MITRNDLEGTLACWYAVDADSHVGVFTGPWAAWPAAVFEDYEAIRAADEFLDSAQPTTEAVLSAQWLASGGNPSIPLAEASHGLYSFDADPGYGGQTVYHLDASPVRPLLESEAAPVLRRAAGLVRLPSIRFAAVEQIDISGLVPIIVGGG